MVQISQKWKKGVYRILGDRDLQVETRTKLEEFEGFYRAYLTKLDRARGDEEVTEAQAKILMEVGRHPACLVMQLSEYLHMDKGNLSRRLKKLEEAGYVKRFPVDEDRRLHVLILSRTGRKLVNRMEWNEGAADFSSLTEAECSQLQSAADAMMRILPKVRVQNEEEHRNEVEV